MKLANGIKAATLTLALAGLAAPAFSQTTTTTPDNTAGRSMGVTTTSARDHDSGDWGWLGLLGLAGLAGLFRKRDADNTQYSTGGAAPRR